MRFKMRNVFKALGFAILLSACTMSPRDDLEAKFSAMDTSRLWLEQSTSRSFVELSHVEVELVSRGEISRGSDYIGRRSSGMFGGNNFPRIQGSSNIYNCSDFPTSLAAQTLFLEEGGPTNDPHNLDADGDGLACEWGTNIRRYAQENRPKRAAIPRRSYTPRRSYSNCYTGPRGGTYTITASGRKNYGGC